MLILNVFCETEPEYQKDSVVFQKVSIPVPQPI